MRLINSIGVKESVAYMYPLMYDVTNMDPSVGELNEQGIMKLPRIVRVSAERMNSQNIYLAENGRHMFLWIGRDVSNDKIQALFGVESLAVVQPFHKRLTNPNSAFSKQLNLVISYLRDNRHRYMALTIVRQQIDVVSESRFQNLLIEDANLDSKCYVDFLVDIHKSVQNEVANK